MHGTLQQMVHPHSTHNIEVTGQMATQQKISPLHCPLYRKVWPLIVEVTLQSTKLCLLSDSKSAPLMDLSLIRSLVHI